MSTAKIAIRSQWRKNGEANREGRNQRQHPPEGGTAVPLPRRSRSSIALIAATSCDAAMEGLCDGAMHGSGSRVPSGADMSWIRLVCRNCGLLESAVIGTSDAHAS